MARQVLCVHTRLRVPSSTVVNVLLHVTQETVGADGSCL